ncbi:MAG: hypothetical protein SangKO_054590 [Sandaracinaceae bacterium]
MRAAVLGAWLSSLTLLAPFPTSAQSPATSPAYEAGIDALERGFPEEALTHFERAVELDPRPHHVLALAATLQELRRPTEAIAWYDRLLAEEFGPLAEDRRRAVAGARASAASLQGRLRITTSATGQVEVEVDGVSAGVVTADAALEVSLDSGPHVVRVVGGASSRVSVAVGEVRSVAVEAAPPAASVIEERAEAGRDPAPWIVFSLAAIPLAVGVGTAIPFQLELDQARAEREHALAVPHAEAAETFGLVATISFAISGSIALASLVWGLVEISAGAP